MVHVDEELVPPGRVREEGDAPQRTALEIERPRPVRIAQRNGVPIALGIRPPDDSTMPLRIISWVSSPIAAIFRQGVKPPACVTWIRM